MTPFDFIFTAIFNIVEFPVTYVTTGFSEKTLPIGVQVASIKNNDRLTIAVAQMLEDAAGGWRRARFV